MGGRVLALVALTVGLGLLLASWAAVPSLFGGSGFSIAAYALASTVLFTDLLDLMLRLYLRRQQAAPAPFGTTPAASIPLDSAYTPYQKRVFLRPYAILLSVYNAVDDLDDFIAAMAPFRERIWIIDDASGDVTAQRLRQAGYRCISGQSNRKKPGAIKALLRDLPPQIETVLVFDPDTHFVQAGHDALYRLDTIVYDFQHSRMAAATPRLIIREDGLLPGLQRFEYYLSFRLGRSSMGDYCTNSGISMYRRDALQAALAEHSLSVYAEDLENSLLILGRGEGIYYEDRLAIETEGKLGWRPWTSQRVGWTYGLLKVYMERFGCVRRIAARSFGATYHYLIYLGIFTLLFQPLKMLGLGLLALSLFNGLDELLYLEWVPDNAATNPVYFIATYIQYTLLALLGLYLAGPRSQRLALLEVIPFYYFYALAMIAIAGIGYGNWLALKLLGRRLFQDHYQDEASLQRENGKRLVIRQTGNQA